MPDNTTPFPYKKHAVELWKSGIPIIQDGEMILLAINDYIELSIIWGNKTNIDILQNKKLRELDSNQNDYIRWNDDPENRITNGKKDYGFAYANFGHESSDIRYRHPFVSVDWIISKITQIDGFQSFSFPNKIDDEKAKIFIPLIEKNADETTTQKNYIKIKSEIDGIVGSRHPLLGLINDTFHLTLESVENRSEDISLIDGLDYIKANNAGTIFFDGSVEIKTKLNKTIYADSPQLIINSKEKKEDGTIGYGRIHIKIPMKVKTIDGVDNISIELSRNTTYKNGSDETEPLLIELEKEEYIELSVYFKAYDANTEYKITASMNVHFESPTVPFGALYPIIPNLPDITCL
jgi:hypothetical protein